MYLFFLVVGMLIGWGVFFFSTKLFKKKSQAVEESGKDSARNKSSYTGTKDLCIKALESLNCRVEVDEEQENRVFFDFQGERFHMDATNDCAVVTIWDLWWYEVPLDDLERMSKARKMINEMNINSDNTLMFSMDVKDNLFAVHTKRSFLLVKEIPNIEGYVSAMLESFFPVQRNYLSLLDKKEEEGHS